MLPWQPNGRRGPPTAAQWAARPAPRAPAGPTSRLSLLQGDQLLDADADPPPPRRPLASSWEANPGTDPRPGPPTPVKGSQVVLQMVDLEQDEAEDDDGGESVVEDKARRTAEAAGAGTLYAAFLAAYGDRHALAPVDQLPRLLHAAGLPVAAEAVDAAIHALNPEPTGFVSFQQCQELFRHLQGGRGEPRELPPAHAGGFSRWLTQLSDQDSTNLLLGVVVTLCCVSAFLAGGLAILLLMVDGVQAVKDNLQDSLGVVQDSMEFYAGQIAVQEAEERQRVFALTLASVLQNVAYASTVAANTAQLFRVTTSVANALGAWWYSVPDQAFGHLAAMTGLLTQSSLGTYGLDRTTAIVDEMTAGLPPTLELLLGRWKANATANIDVLTDFRYRSQCVNATCALSGAAAAPMAAALAGRTGGLRTVDYRGVDVYTGFSNASGLGVQLTYGTWTLTLQRYAELVALLNGWTADPANSWEYLLGYMPSPGVRSLLSTLPGCDVACGQTLVADGTPLARALAGEAGTMEYVNFRGVRAVVSFAPIPGTHSALAVQMAFADIVQLSLGSTAALVDRLNQRFPTDSEEVELVAFAGQGNDTVFTHLSEYRFNDQCPAGQCMPDPPYIRLAAADCSEGVVRTTDYRGQQVIAGYRCIRELNAILSIKQDVEDLDTSVLETLLEEVNSHNEEDPDGPTEFLVALPRAGLTAEDVRGYADFELVSRLKNPEGCVNPNCTWNRESALRALENLKDVVDTTNYRNEAVLAASARSTAIRGGMGLALEQSRQNAMQPIVDTAVKVGCFAVGMVAGCTVVLIFVVRAFLRSMIRAKEEGNRVVEVEKERFSKLVASMYPSFVVPQLLEGDKQLVCEVPEVAVFFSDIHEFTSASNTMQSVDLLRLMGYVYGTMDLIADRFGVFKVKTIGDAYLAVRGLPGSDTENPGLDLLRFASCVCQVFGDRFVHPTEGQVLAAMNKAMAWNTAGHRKSRLSRGPPRAADAASVAPSKGPARTLRKSVVSVAASEATRVSAGGGEAGGGAVQCIMSYGLAVGKVVAGVLGGRCPMFDIWGATVNLASRMQSTGEPGRIQVSEQLYKKVIAVPDQPFTFEAPRSALCKGFGAVNAYMVRGTSEGVPKDLQARLRLEPRYGAFRFDNVLGTSPPVTSGLG